MFHPVFAAIQRSSEPAAGAFALLFSACMCMLPFLAIAMVILGTIFWIWMLIEAATKEPDQGNDKLVWILVIVLTHLLGALIYYFVRRPQRKRQYGR